MCPGWQSKRTQTRLRWPTEVTPNNDPLRAKSRHLHPAGQPITLVNSAVLTPWWTARPTALDGQTDQGPGGKVPWSAGDRQDHSPRGIGRRQPAKKHLRSYEIRAYPPPILSRLPLPSAPTLHYQPEGTQEEPVQPTDSWGAIERLLSQPLNCN